MNDVKLSLTVILKRLFRIIYQQFIEMGLSNNTASLATKTITLFI